MSRNVLRQVAPPHAAFALRLKEAQEAKGLKTEALAREIGVGLRVVQHWRSGKVEPKGQNLIALAEALGVDPRWFYADHSDTKVAA